MNLPRPEISDREAADLRDKVGRGLGWSVANTFIVRLGGLASGVLIARLLSPHDYGVFAVAAILLNAALSMNELGCSLAVVKWPANRLTHIAPTVASVSLVSSLILYVACYAAAPTVADLLAAPEASPMIRLLCIAILVDAVSAVPSALITRYFLQRRRLVMDVVSFVSGTGLTIVLAFQDLGAWALAWGFLLSNVVAGVLSVALAPTWYGYGFSLSAARELTGFGLPLAAASILFFLMLNIDYVVVGPILGTTQLGLYLFAFNLCNWPVNLISSVVRRVSLAGFSRVSAESDEGPRAFAASSGLVITVAGPACLILGALASPLIRVVYGHQWGPAASVLTFLCVLALVRIVGELVYDYLVANGRPLSVMLLQGAWVVGLLPALFVAATWWGITGVGAAHALVAALLVVPMIVVLLGRCGIAPGDLWRAWRAPLTSSAAAGAVGYATAQYVVDPVALVLGGLLAALTYFTLMHRRLISLWRRLRRAVPRT